MGWTAQIPWLADLDSAARSLLESRSSRRSLPAGAVLFVAGTRAAGVWFVISGQVRVTRLTADRVHVIHGEGPGGTLGEVPVFLGVGYLAIAMADTEDDCRVVPRATLERAIAADPRLGSRLLARLARRVQTLVERLDALAGQTVTARLARFLLDRTTAASGDPVAAIGMTQTELAAELGTVREVVVRSLRQLRRAGLIGAAGRGKLLVRDRAGLALVADGVATPLRLSSPGS
jgi:CRP/FNR family transcriptional regulator